MLQAAPDCPFALKFLDTFVNMYADHKEVLTLCMVWISESSSFLSTLTATCLEVQYGLPG
jgi:hypothetical protein